MPSGRIKRSSVVTELQFHHLILASMGIAGILWFHGAYRLPRSWSPIKRFLLGIGSGLGYLLPALSAFANLSSASSLELFGFVGCLLGCFGAARIMSVRPMPIDGPATAHGEA
jgi:hypothetical protein